MAIVNGACTKCGCAEHECECAEREKAIRADKVEEYLLAMSVQVRPGEVRFKNHNCFDCRDEGDVFMVQDQLWDSAWPTYREDRAMLVARCKTMYPDHYEDRNGRLEPKWGKGARALLCLHCLEKRAGRRLVLDDFTDVRVNDKIRFGHLMGRRELLSQLAVNSEDIDG